jgi:anti-sigma regulatory factor (Ser/Thr protein kinase)
MQNPKPIPLPAADNSSQASWNLPAEPETVGRARRLVRDTLAGWGMLALADDLVMVVSEVDTNAVVHAKSSMALSLHRQGPSVRGQVTDHSTAWPTPLPAGPDEEHGRGLAIVAAYADRWGVTPAPGGKTVWFVCGRRECR